MAKTFSLLLLLTLAFSFAFSQGTENNNDAIIMAAKKDAKNFRFNEGNKKAIIKNLHNPESDYFKPTSMYVSQSSLLNDSLYVKTFKIYANKKIRSRRTTKTLLFVGGGVIIVLATVIAAAVAAGPGLTN